MADLKDTELRMESTSLYREEVYTDRRLGTIRTLTPVKSDGSVDAGRPVLYVGQAHIMTAAGTLPISFEIEATGLAEACAKFGDAAKVAIEETLQEIQELRRQAASQIVVPEPGQASSILTPGGGPAGGKIR